MKIKQLAESLQEIERTDSRNEMTKLLANLFEESDVEEVDKLVYLSLGRLGPLFDNPEFNLAEKQVQKAISRAYDKELDDVNRIYKDMGDLGKVAEKLAADDEGKGLSVTQVWESLEKIAKDKGEGSQDRKIQSLADLLDNIEPLAARYVVRVVIGKLRLGFSDKTVLDAVSWMKRGDKSAKSKLKRAYQVHPDVGRIVAKVKKVGIEKTVEDTELELGVPISPMLCQRLKTTKEMVEKMGKVAVEPKFDGQRVQIHFKRDGKEWKAKAYTRNLEEISHMLPELDRLSKEVAVDELILDSEAVGYDPETGEMLPFQKTMTRKRKHEVQSQADKVPLKFYVFDVLYVDGESLVDKSYQERRKKLQEVVGEGDLLIVDKHWETDDADSIREHHHQLVDKGLEGVIVKKVHSKYVPGRTGWRWVKMKEDEDSHAKLVDTVDCVVMGYYKGKGKRAQFGVGAFLAGVRKGKEIVTITKVGTGLTDDQFKELKDRLDKLEVNDKPKEYEVDKNMEPDVWVLADLVVELAADEVTKSPIHTAGVALRFPRLIRFRDDKNVDQATSLEEVESMSLVKLE